MTGYHHIEIRARLYCGEEIAMGPGKADLLDAIKVHGSISAAGRAMHMSYRRAWLLVDAMNRCWHEPLVATAPGVAHGGGAWVTPFGEQILAQYRSLQTRLDDAASGNEQTVLCAGLLPTPKSSQRRAPVRNPKTSANDQDAR